MLAAVLEQEKWAEYSNIISPQFVSLFQKQTEKLLPQQTYVLSSHLVQLGLCVCVCVYLSAAAAVFSLSGAKTETNASLRLAVSSWSLMMLQRWAQLIDQTEMDQDPTLCCVCWLWCACMCDVYSCCQTTVFLSRKISDFKITLLPSVKGPDKPLSSWSVSSYVTEGSLVCLWSSFRPASNLSRW